MNGCLADIVFNLLGQIKNNIGLIYIGFIIFFKYYLSLHTVIYANLILSGWKSAVFKLPFYFLI
ncbi:hypothetical protein BWD07_03910 [Neisseria canis]|nr:hypothetical protein BWD07_03910 [Neisseria canis]